MAEWMVRGSLEINQTVERSAPSAEGGQEGPSRRETRVDVDMTLAQAASIISMLLHQFEGSAPIIGDVHGCSQTLCRMLRNAAQAAQARSHQLAARVEEVAAMARVLEAAVKEETSADQPLANRDLLYGFIWVLETQIFEVQGDIGAELQSRFCH